MFGIWYISSWQGVDGRLSGQTMGFILILYHLLLTTILVLPFLSPSALSFQFSPPPLFFTLSLVLVFITRVSSPFLRDSIASIDCEGQGSGSGPWSFPIPHHHHNIHKSQQCPTMCSFLHWSRLLIMVDAWGHAGREYVNWCNVVKKNYRASTSDPEQVIKHAPLFIVEWDSLLRFPHKINK